MSKSKYEKWEGRRRRKGRRKRRRERRKRRRMRSRRRRRARRRRRRRCCWSPINEDGDNEREMKSGRGAEMAAMSVNLRVDRKILVSALREI
jgi:hypothetical protein